MSVQIEDGQPRFHGLTNAEWMALLDLRDWRVRIADALFDIVTDPEALADDRLIALQMLNEGIKAELLPPDPELPDLTVCVLLAISTGQFGVRWWRRFGLARRRKATSERLAGIRCLLNTANQFTYEERVARAVEQAKANKNVGVAAAAGLAS